jgi:hypothetical protein
MPPELAEPTLLLVAAPFRTLLLMAWIRWATLGVFVAALAGCYGSGSDNDDEASGGSGGTGGSTTLDSTCETGTNAVCSCLVGTAEECTAENGYALQLYQGCVDGVAEADYVACFADYVDVAAATVDCVTAAEVCIPAMP